MGADTVDGLSFWSQVSSSVTATWRYILFYKESVFLGSATVCLWFSEFESYIMLTICLK